MSATESTSAVSVSAQRPWSCHARPGPNHLRNGRRARRSARHRGLEPEVVNRTFALRHDARYRRYTLTARATFSRNVPTLRDCTAQENQPGEPPTVDFSASQQAI